MENYLRLWDNFFELERIQYSALYVSPETPFGSCCNQYIYIYIYIYKTVPTSEIWVRIADEFNDICKMPNCIGCRERKHCQIKCPPNAGSFYFNYKSFHSMSMLGWLMQTAASH